MKNYKLSTKMIIVFLALLTCTVMHSQQTPTKLQYVPYLDNYDYNNAIEECKSTAEQDSLSAVKSYYNVLEYIEVYHKPKGELKEIKKKGFLANVFDTDKEQRILHNGRISIERQEYEKKINDNKNSLDSKIQLIQQNRDKCINKLKTDRIAAVKYREELERLAEEKRIQDEKDAKIWAAKAEEERQHREAEWAAMPSNPEYRQWKAKYEKLLSLAESNVNNCEAIIKKHTFKNIFGQKIYDSSDFSSAEKKTFNQNLELLSDNVYEMEKLENINDREYYRYWSGTVTTDRSISLYRLSSYRNSKSLAY